MRLTAFETYIRDHLPDQMSLKGLASEVGVCRQSLYRRFVRAPWREGRGTFEGRLFSRLAVVLRETDGITGSQLDRSRNLLLWMAGFNPFAERGLSAEETQALYEATEAKVAELVARRAARGA